MSSSEFRVRSSEFGVQSSEYGVRSTEYGVSYQFLNREQSFTQIACFKLLYNNAITQTINRFNCYVR